MARRIADTSHLEARLVALSGFECTEGSISEISNTALISFAHRHLTALKSNRCLAGITAYLVGILFDLQAREACRLWIEGIRISKECILQHEFQICQFLLTVHISHTEVDCKIEQS